MIDKYFSVRTSAALLTWWKAIVMLRMYVPSCNLIINNTYKYIINRLEIFMRKNIRIYRKYMQNIYTLCAAYTFAKY